MWKNLELLCKQTFISDLNKKQKYIYLNIILDNLAEMNVSTIDQYLNILWAHIYL